MKYLRSNEQSLNLVVKNGNNKCRQIIKKKVIFLPEFPFNTCFKEQTCGLWVIGGLSLSMLFVINDFSAKQLSQNRKGQNTISSKELRK